MPRDDLARLIEAGGVPPRGALERLLCRAEEWIYDLNARDHWLFRLYEWGNVAWAWLVFRGVRRRAAAIDTPLTSRDGVRMRFRFLTPADEDAFAAMLARFDFENLPPHPLDRASAARVLRQANCLPFGYFDERGELGGYLLLRFFFFWRVTSGVWSFPRFGGRGLTQAGLRVTAELTRAEGLADYITVPVGHNASLGAATGAGWQVVRTNRRFHVLLNEHTLARARARRRGNAACV
jgi:hypothetical protein